MEVLDTGVHLHLGQSELDMILRLSEVNDDFLFIDLVETVDHRLDLLLRSS